jgi:hypothetical protein
MKKIVGFGDSFVFGSELQNNHDGSKSWIGLAAKNLGVSYETCAVPGCGNDNIARQIYSYFSENSAEDTLAVINWTWSNRWDFYIVNHETWITLGPTCVPEKLQTLVDKTQSHRLVEFYKDYANSSITWNKFRNLQTIYAVQSYLQAQNILAVQTFMDPIMFDTTYHAPNYIVELQNLVSPQMENFEGLTFLEWSQQHGFPITDPGWHPLEAAHEAASILWQERYAQLLF